jgi:sugar lactone lactonase YvrE
MLTIVGCGSSGGNDAGASNTVQLGGAIQGKSLSLSTVVTTLAGTASNRGETDGTGATARFDYPTGITTDGTNLYIVETVKRTIRKIVISTGTVTTLAGSPDVTGSTDGIGAAATFFYPLDITTDGKNLYVADGGNTIRKVVITTGVVTTIAGTAGTTGSTDSTGTAARFGFITGITTDGTNLYVSESGNNTIRKVVISSGAVSTIAGTPGTSGSANGIGAAARFYNPTAITTDGRNLYITTTQSGYQSIRKMDISTSAVTTLANSTSFYNPSGITTDGTYLYVTDVAASTIQKIDIITGVVTTIAGGTWGAIDGIGTAAMFYQPIGITTDGKSLFVADSSNRTIRKIQ